MNTYNTIVGMEIHVGLKTESKMFCGCKNDPFHAPEPNIYTCPVCLGLPGALPVANKKAVEWTIKLGLALGATIADFSKFDRKNYFYPDIPKGYQISQYDQPLCRGGLVKTAFGDVRIHRVHLEEDTGKLLHQTVNGEKVSLVDFNRSGIPLVEIVTEPDIHTTDQAREFMKKLHQIIRYLDISDADMEKGTMRIEPNISLQKDSETELPDYKVEVKNINSYRFVVRAMEYELKRHQELLDNGETPEQETRGWDEKKNITVSQRKKEEAHDYRYFPDPDLPPMRFTKEYIDGIRKQLPEMPDATSLRFVKDFQLKQEDAERLTDERELADYFESVQRLASSVQRDKITAQSIANWILNKKVDITKVTPEELIKTISTASQVVQVDAGELNIVIDKVLAANLKPVEDYKKGKTGVIMFFVGQVMRELKGRGDASAIRKLLEKKLQ